MADYEAKIAPFINQIFYVTSQWWEQPRNHRGLDIATPKSAGDNIPVYSMCEGKLVYKSWDQDGYGNYIIMKDNITNMGFLYAHLKNPSPLNVGDSVKIGQEVGIEGTTGSSTGIHLHLEMQDLTNHDWVFHAPKEYYSNPAEFMGIPNQEGISVIYNGTPIPPDPPDPPIPTQGITNWKKWFLLKSKKIIINT